jgi:[ribosomal protein S5]-alanine N-acetyltransferase
MTVLETKRLIIRPWRREDVPCYQELSRDVGYNCFAPPGFFLVSGDKEAEEKIDQRISSFEENKCGKFPVFLKGGEFIGTCGFSPCELNGQKEIELGYRLLLKHWGKGYATEAARAVIAHAFNGLTRKQVFAFAIEQNPASLRIIEKLEFKYQSPLMYAGLEHRLFIMTDADYCQKVA